MNETQSLQINLNSASAAVLSRIPGVTPVLAARIVRMRTSGGGFDDVNDLADITGITPALIARIATYVEK